MSRIAPLNPPYPPDIQAQFENIMPPDVDPLVLFRTLAVNDRAWRKFRAGSLLDHGPLSLREREIVIDRTCALTGCEYEWGVHVTIFAQAAGLSEADVVATVNGLPSAPGWSPAEVALITAVDALHYAASLDQARFDDLRAFYDEAQILEILLLAGFYRTVAYLANSLDLPLEPGAARFPV